MEKISFARCNRELSHYNQICSDLGGQEFLISHLQVLFLLYMMKQNWKIILLKNKESTTRFVPIVMTARNYNLP